MELKGFFEGLERHSEACNPTEPGDYIKDGLLYCGKCNTPRQTVVQFPWGEHRPRVLCECRKQEKEREDNERKERERAEKIEEMRRGAFIHREEMIGWTFEADDHKNERISTVMRNYVECFDEMLQAGKGLLLFGNTGTGKTFHAACAVNALTDKGYRCLMTDFGTVINEISGRFNGKQEYIDSFNQYALVVIDDLFAERDTEYAGEIVYNVINSRYNAGLPLIVTTNLTADELKTQQDIRRNRIYSRLFEMCIPIEVTGTDRRKEKLKSDYNELKEKLGL